MICRFVIRICLHSTLPLGFCRFGCQFPQSDNLAPLRAPAALVSAVLVVNSRKVTTSLHSARPPPWFLPFWLSIPAK